MRFGKLTFKLAIVAVVAIPAAFVAAEVRKLKESDVLKLVELQIRDDAIVERIAASGVAFKVEDAVLERFRKAGASDAVLDALRNTDPVAKDKPAAPSRSLMLWVERDYSRDCPLHSDITINDQLIDRYSSNAQRSIGAALKPGWNKIVMKTAVLGSEAAGGNQLVFHIGYVSKDPKSKKQSMDVVLWKFDNGTDWQLTDGKYHHKTGPSVREITTHYTLFLAGVEQERTKVKAGDYVLTGEQDYSRNSPVTATVYVNGTALTSFLGQRRDLVITPWLKQGKNEIRIVTHRSPNVVGSNDLAFHIGGPAEYSATQSKFVVTPVLDFKSITGWQQNRDTGLWHSEAKPDSESFERTPLSFTLDQAPKN